MATDAAELVANIFSAAIGILIVSTVYYAIFLEDTGAISNIISDFAAPFFAFLILIYIIVSILEGGG